MYVIMVMIQSSFNLLFLLLCQFKYCSFVIIITLCLNKWKKKSWSFVMIILFFFLISEMMIIIIMIECSFWLIDYIIKQTDYYKKRRGREREQRKQFMVMIMIIIINNLLFTNEKDWNFIFNLFCFYKIATIHFSFYNPFFKFQIPWPMSPPIDIILLPILIKHLARMKFDFSSLICRTIFLSNGHSLGSVF